MTETPPGTSPVPSPEQESFIRGHKRLITFALLFLSILGYVVYFLVSGALGSYAGIYTTEGGRGYLVLERDLIKYRVSEGSLGISPVIVPRQSRARANGRSLTLYLCYNKYGKYYPSYFYELLRLERDLDNSMRLESFAPSYFSPDKARTPFSPDEWEKAPAPWKRALQEFLLPFKHWNSVPPSAGKVPAFMCPIQDNRIPRYFRLVESEHPPHRYPRIPLPSYLGGPSPHADQLRSLADGMVTSHPANLHVRILALDARIRQRDAKAAREALTRWKADFLAARASDPMAWENFEKAEQSTLAMESVHSGKDGIAFLSSALDSNSTLPLSMRFDIFEKIVEAQAIRPVQPLVSPSPGREHLLVRLFGRAALNQSFLHLLSGQPLKCQDLLLALYQAGLLFDLAGDSYESTFIEIMARIMALRELETYVCNHVRTAEECNHLEQGLKRLSLLTDSNDCQPTSYWNTRIQLPIPAWAAWPGASSSYRDNLLRQGLNTKFNLLRLFNQMRKRQLSGWCFPTTTGSLSLVQISDIPIPIDPFSPTSSPLSATLESSQTLVLYSVGPDGVPQGGKLPLEIYDDRILTGKKPAGDICMKLKSTPVFIIPEGGLRASTTETVHNTFPRGLPYDHLSYEPMQVLRTTSGTICILSSGPDEKTSLTRHLEYDPTLGPECDDDQYVELPPEK